MKFLWLRSLSSLLLTIAMVAGFGFLGFKGAFLFWKSVPDDFLSGWTSLGFPPGKAVSIQATTFNFGKTVIKSANGKYYVYRPLAISKWVETTWQYDERTVLTPVCQSFYRPPTSLPHPIVDCSGSFTWEWQRTEDITAVLDNGSVWRWRYGTGLLEALLFTAIVTILGAIIGFLLSKPIRKLILKNLK